MATNQTTTDFSAEVVNHCERALDGSAFFRALAARPESAALIRYAFLQYRFFRDQLHRWFGLCIVKAPNCRDSSHKAAIMALADHIFTDLRDAHEEMYDRFLRDLQISDADTARERPSRATARYIRSYLEEFDLDTGDFFVALAALAGRELCVSLRNQRLIACYFVPREIETPTWIGLHSHLELDHFQDAIRPVLAAHPDESPTFAAARSSVERAINRHVRLFDDLLGEFEATCARQA
jgi:hypothetical protein